MRAGHKASRPWRAGRRSRPLQRSEGQRTNERRQQTQPLHGSSAVLRGQTVLSVGKPPGRETQAVALGPRFVRDKTVSRNSADRRDVNRRRRAICRLCLSLSVPCSCFSCSLEFSFAPRKPTLTRLGGGLVFDSCGQGNGVGAFSHETDGAPTKKSEGEKKTRAKSDARFKRSRNAAAICTRRRPGGKRCETRRDGSACR